MTVSVGDRVDIVFAPPMIGSVQGVVQELDKVKGGGFIRLMGSSGNSLLVFARNISSIVKVKLPVQQGDLYWLRDDVFTASVSDASHEKDSADDNKVVWLTRSGHPTESFQQFLEGENR